MHAALSKPETLLDDMPRAPEFRGLKPHAALLARPLRLDSEARAQSVYVPSRSDAYWDLRDEITQLEEDLENALLVGVRNDAKRAIRFMPRRARVKDPMRHPLRVQGHHGLLCRQPRILEVIGKHSALAELGQEVGHEMPAPLHGTGPHCDYLKRGLSRAPNWGR